MIQRRAGLALRTLQQCRAGLRRALHEGLYYGVIERNAGALTRLLVVQPLPTKTSTAKGTRRASVCRRAWLVLISQLLVATGFRASDMPRLSWEDVEERPLTVPCRLEHVGGE